MYSKLDNLVRGSAFSLFRMLAAVHVLAWFSLNAAGSLATGHSYLFDAADMVAILVIASGLAVIACHIAHFTMAVVIEHRANQR